MFQIIAWPVGQLPQASDDSGDLLACMLSSINVLIEKVFFSLIWKIGDLVVVFMLSDIAGLAEQLISGFDYHKFNSFLNVIHKPSCSLVIDAVLYVSAVDLVTSDMSFICEGIYCRIISLSCIG